MQNYVQHTEAAAENARIFSSDKTYLGLETVINQSVSEGLFFLFACLPQNAWNSFLGQK